MNHNRSFLGVAFLVLVPLLSALGQNSADEAKQLFQQAQDLAKAEKFDAAISALKKALPLAPRNDLYLATISHYELKAGRFANGLEHALQALRLNDRRGAYHVLVAAHALGLQDIDRARAECERVLKGGPSVYGPEPCKDATILKDQLVRKTYTLFWNLDPKKGRTVAGALVLALPKDKLPYQSATFEISGAKSHRVVKSDVNDVLYVVPQGNQPFTLTTKVTVWPYSFKKQLAKTTAARSLPPDARASLGSAEAMNVKSPALAKVVAGLKGSSNADTARNILAWMKKHIEYKLEGTSIVKLDFKSMDEILQRGHAECRGYAMLFTALCRAAGVPARPVWGLARVGVGQDKRFGDIASHNWAEFYVLGVGWVPVDPQRPETLGFLPTNCMKFSIDARKSSTSTEDLGKLNLIIMNGAKLKFEESR